MYLQSKLFQNLTQNTIVPVHLVYKLENLGKQYIHVKTALTFQKITV